MYGVKLTENDKRLGTGEKVGHFLMVPTMFSIFFWTMFSVS